MAAQVHPGGRKPRGGSWGAGHPSPWLPAHRQGGKGMGRRVHSSWTSPCIPILTWHRSAPQSNQGALPMPPAKLSRSPLCSRAKHLPLAVLGRWEGGLSKEQLQSKEQQVASFTAAGRWGRWQQPNHRERVRCLLHGWAQQGSLCQQALCLNRQIKAQLRNTSFCLQGRLRCRCCPQVRIPP